MAQAGTRRIAFYALPPNSTSPPAATVPLYECTADDGRLDYSVNPATELPGFRRNEKHLRNHCVESGKTRSYRRRIVRIPIVRGRCNGFLGRYHIGGARCSS